MVDLLGVVPNILRILQKPLILSRVEKRFWQLLRHILWPVILRVVLGHIAKNMVQNMAKKSLRLRALDYLIFPKNQSAEKAE